MHWSSSDLYNVSYFIVVKSIICRKWPSENYGVCIFLALSKISPSWAIEKCVPRCSVSFRETKEVQASLVSCLLISNAADPVGESSSVWLECKCIQTPSLPASARTQPDGKVLCLRLYLLKDITFELEFYFEHNQTFLNASQSFSNVKFLFSLPQLILHRAVCWKVSQCCCLHV